MSETIEKAAQIINEAEIYHGTLKNSPKHSPRESRNRLCKLLDAIPFRRVTGPGQVKEGDLVIFARNRGLEIVKVEGVNEHDRFDEYFWWETFNGCFQQVTTCIGRKQEPEAAYILDLSGLGGEG